MCGWMDGSRRHAVCPRDGTCGVRNAPLTDAVSRGGTRRPAPERDHVVDAEPGGVDADGVVGRPQRRHRATGIAGVAGENLAQQTVDCDGNPFVFQLLIAPFGTLLGARGQEHLVRGIGEDDGPHVAAVGHQPRGLAECALAVLEGGPDLGDGGDRRRRRAGGLGAQFVGGIMAVDQHPQVARLALAEADRGVEGAAHQGAGIVQVQVGPARGDADRPVQGAGIQVMPAQALGDDAADRALAGAGGAIDGEHGRRGVHPGIIAARAPTGQDLAGGLQVMRASA
jgi:hypothetical protein